MDEKQPHSVFVKIQHALFTVFQCGSCLLMYKEIFFQQNAIGAGIFYLSRTTIFSLSFHVFPATSNATFSSTIAHIFPSQTGGLPKPKQ